MEHTAQGHANQDFNRVYNYNSSFNNNHLESFDIGSNSFSNTYDANGNLTKEGASRHYYWNSGDKLAAFSNQVGTADPTVFIWYFYTCPERSRRDASGERIKKLVKKGQQVEVTFYMDGGMFETSYVKPTGGSIDNNRFYNTLHVLDGSSRISTIRVGTDADDPTPAIKYYLEDHLMDSLVVLNTSGNLVNREEFYPFGETSFGGYGKKRYRYNGKEKDEHTGLYEYGQRYYAPWLCRFVSVDPIAEDYPQYTSYNYAGNKPISKMDLEGLQEQDAEQGGNSSTNNNSQNQSSNDIIAAYTTAELLLKIHGNNTIEHPLGFLMNTTPNRDKQISVANDIRSAAIAHTGITPVEFPESTGLYDESYNNRLSEYLNYTLSEGAQRFDEYHNLLQTIYRDSVVLDFKNQETAQNYRDDIEAFSGTGLDTALIIDRSLYVQDYLQTMGGMDKLFATSIMLETAVGLGPSTLKNLNTSVTNNQGFLGGGFTFRLPFNMNVQRFGNMSLTKMDYWGIRLGESKLLNRAFNAIKPKWNDLSQLTEGVIPKGTEITVGIVGPQGPFYPGGSIQFMVNSKEVIKQTTKIVR